MGENTQSETGGKDFEFFNGVLINKLFEEDICTLRAETFAN